METPVMEALSYLDMEREERSGKRMEEFHMLYFGANSRVDPKARKTFYDKIKPKEAGRKLLNNANKRLEWDYGSLDEFRAKK